ncbi:hypothetical protein GCM10025864_21470 [Luteimicrobium album]|uniref:Uncharacterized protein n=1 Tax=Luteimicrobium album TaxID=1054550 RepID=A0ABQ6I0W9_9MICO|nr:hypothetical protein [Luteimicrobium album]GMA24388.1 hypothetical protein GCM10025864_21470 [Luteimicrobium album]
MTGPERRVSVLVRDERALVRAGHATIVAWHGLDVVGEVADGAATVRLPANCGRTS